MAYKKTCVLMLTLIMLLSSYGCKKEVTNSNEVISNQAEAVVEKSISNSYASSDEDIQHEKHLVEASGWIYYHNTDDMDKLYKRSMDGSKSLKMIDNYVGSYCLDGEWIYYSDTGDDSSLCKVKTDGSVKETLNNDRSSSINVSKEWIYYRNSSDNDRIYKIKKDGSDRTKLGEDSVSNLYVGAGDWVYYTNTSEDNHIYVIGMDGKERTKVTNTSSYSLFVSEDWIYYGIGDTKEINYSRIYKIKRNGTEETYLASAKQGEAIGDLEGLENYLYYNLYYSDEALCRIKKDGTDFAILSSKSEHVGTYDVSKGGLLFTSTFYNGYIYKMDLKSKKETLINKPPALDAKHLAEWIIYNDRHNTLGLNVVKKDRNTYNELYERTTSKIKVLEDTAYFLVESEDCNNLYRIDINNSEPKMIAEGNIVTYDISRELIYYYDSSDHTIYKVKADGTEKKQVSKNRAEYIEVNEEWIYFIYMGTEIHRIRLDGTEEQKLVSSSLEGISFKIYDGWIYYSGEKGLYKIKTDGTDNKKLYEDIYGVGNPLSIKDGRIYFEILIAEGGGYYNWINGLYSIKLDGTDKQTLSEDTTTTWAIVNNSIYYSKIVRDINIMKTKHDGTERKVIIPNLEWH